MEFIKVFEEIENPRYTQIMNSYVVYGNRVKPLQMAAEQLGIAIHEAAINEDGVKAIQRYVAAEDFARLGMVVKVMSAYSGTIDEIRHVEAYNNGEEVPCDGPAIDEYKRPFFICGRFKVTATFPPEVEPI
jgi:hypothetical protein